MRKFFLAAALATASLIPAGAAMASQVNVAATGPVVDVSVTEEVKGKPDVATFSTGVQVLAATANDAIRQNNTQMTAVVAKLKKLGIADKDIQTSEVSLSQQYDYRDGAQKFTGYQASNMVNFKLRDLKKLGALLDALASDGATNFNGPRFEIEDDSKQKSAARDKAWAAATALAKVHAAKAGYSNVRAIRVEEGVGPQFYAGNEAVAAAADAVAYKSETPIAPGEVATSITLSFTFEMVK